jgi:hypothetical protein
MNIENLLDAEIRDELENLKQMELGSDEYRTTVDGVTKLTDRSIELKKIEIEQQYKNESLQFDNHFKRLQIKHDQKDRKIKNGIAIGTIIVPACITIWGALKSWEFEKEGTVTTIMGRGFINKLLPKK